MRIAEYLATLAAMMSSGEQVESDMTGGQGAFIRCSIGLILARRKMRSNLPVIAFDRGNLLQGERTSPRKGLRRSRVVGAS